MDADERKLAAALCAVFDLNDNPDDLEGEVRSLLHEARRGDSEPALRQSAAKIQSKWAGRVSDDECRRAAEIAKQIAHA